MTDADKELQEMEKAIEQKKAEEEVAQPEPVKEPEPDPIQEPAKEEAQPEEGQNESGESGFNATEWVKKKGWKTPEDAAKSMRELEKAFHEKSQELNKSREVPPVPAYTPPPPAYAPPASYQPPANPYAPPAPNEEQIAASYGFTVEDFRRVLKLQNDMASIHYRQIAAEQQRLKEDHQKMMEREADKEALFSDPAFSYPEVKYEVHQVMTNNPAVWNERRPFSTALKEALGNLGRKNVTRGNVQSDVALPNTPPTMAGGNSRASQAGRRMGSLPSEKELQGKTPEELEKMLKGMGAVKTYSDM